MILDVGGELENKAAGLDSRMRETQPDMRSQGRELIELSTISFGTTPQVRSGALRARLGS
jgi:hypothetical protein